MSLAIVAGAGPGLGHALLRRLAAGGYSAVGLARSPSAGGTFEVRKVDLADADEVQNVVAELVASYGPPKIVMHNPAQLLMGELRQTSLSDFEACWRSMTLSAFNLAQAVLPLMAGAGGGSFIVSGATASIRGGARFAAFASAKFALRGLTQSLARAYQPQAIHVAHVILDGIVDSEKSRVLHSFPIDQMMQADDIAETFWHIAHQARSTWTHELDLRPQSEGF